jgi:sugar/nucleoside kinase (ribokinase family)
MKKHFDRIIGVGGIGSGILFETDSNRTLDRNESRMAVLSDARDYCKQHIILHYAATVLADHVDVQAIGLLGNDSEGDRLLLEMKHAGIKTSMVHQISEYPTLYSVCLQYPDRCVCNITTSNSACDKVSADFISNCLRTEGITIDERTLILAVPEVPVSSRLSLLLAGKKNNATCVASVLCDEVEEFRDGGGFENCDVLSVNETEAKAISGSKSDELYTVVKECGNYLHQINPDIKLVVTCGRNGSFSNYRGLIEHIEAGPALPVSTAGAGDAYLAGLICGLVMGFPLQHEKIGKKSIRATDLAFFLAEESVKSKHTISDEINRENVMEFIKKFVEDS